MLDSLLAAFGSDVKVDISMIDMLISTLTRSPPAIVVTIGDSKGGPVDKFASAVMELEELPAKIIFAGKCTSACTMMLKLSDKACATEESEFYFHSVRGRYADGREVRLDKKREKEGNETLMRHYPEKIKQSIIAGGGLPYDGLLYVKGTDILPKCT